MPALNASRDMCMFIKHKYNPAGMVMGYALRKNSQQSVRDSGQLLKCSENLVEKDNLLVPYLDEFCKCSFPICLSALFKHCTCHPCTGICEADGNIRFFLYPQRCDSFKASTCNVEKMSFQQLPLRENAFLMINWKAISVWRKNNRNSFRCFANYNTLPKQTVIKQ